MTREQECQIELIALGHGRVAVHDGFVDRKVRVTVPDSTEFSISEDGVPTKVGYNHSVNWNEYE